MSDAEFFISRFEEKQQDIMIYFHDILKKQYHLSEKIRYNLPFYYGKSWICYLNPKKIGVELAFIRGNELTNESQQYLDARGRKQVFSIIYQDRVEIPESTIEKVIEEAIALDQAIPYASKRKG